MILIFGATVPSSLHYYCSLQEIPGLKDYIAKILHV